MNGYLQKPYRAAELIGAVELFSKTGEAASSKTVDKKEPPILLSNGGDTEESKAQQNNFIKECPEHLLKLNKALDDRSVRQTFKETEWIKIAAGGIGAKRIKILSIRLNGKVEMQYWNDALRVFNELEQELKGVMEHLSMKG